MRIHKAYFPVKNFQFCKACETDVIFHKVNLESDTEMQFNSYNCMQMTITPITSFLGRT
jgi:hypothetical protein